MGVAIAHEDRPSEPLLNQNTSALNAEVEADVRRIAHRLAETAKAPQTSPLASARRQAMALTSRDPKLKTALFRLVDVAPACYGPKDLAEHLNAYIADGPVSRLTKLVGRASRLKRITGAVATASVDQMARQFIVAEHPAAAAGILGKAWDDGVASSIDLLGEASVNHQEADLYAMRCLEAVEALSAASQSWSSRPLLETDSWGVLPRVNLSVKVSALTPLMRSVAPQRGQEDAAARLRPVLRRARDLGVHIQIDTESMDSRDAVLGLALGLLGEEEFREGPSAGLVLQGYLVDSADQLEEILTWARASQRTSPLTIRLVKGAYWDHEMVEAEQNGWAPPVFALKAETDRNFERLTRTLVDAGIEGTIRLAVASHNLRSLAHAIAYHRARGGKDTDLEIQILRGLGDDLQPAVLDQGLRVRAYCPVGDLRTGMAYLIRRLLENTANDSFLVERSKGGSLDDLLVAP